MIGFGPGQFFALQQLGYEIPGDVAYAALDVEQTRLTHVESVAGINQDLTLIGWGTTSDGTTSKLAIPVSGDMYVTALGGTVTMDVTVAATAPGASVRYAHFDVKVVNAANQPTSGQTVTLTGPGGTLTDVLQDVDLTPDQFESFFMFLADEGIEIIESEFEQR